MKETLYDWNHNIWGGGVFSWTCKHLRLHLHLYMTLHHVNTFWHTRSKNAISERYTVQEKSILRYPWEDSLRIRTENQFSKYTFPNDSNASAKMKREVELEMGLGEDQWNAAVVDWLFLNTVSSVLKLNLQQCLVIAIFRIPSDTISLNATQKQILDLTSLIARRTLILNWRSTGSPSVSQWLKDTISFLKLEKLLYAVRFYASRIYPVESKHLNWSLIKPWVLSIWVQLLLKVCYEHRQHEWERTWRRLFLILGLNRTILLQHFCFVLEIYTFFPPQKSNGSVSKKAEGLWVSLT